MKRLLLLLSALIALVLSGLAYFYLAPALFYLGLSRFYDIAPQVTEQCANIVADSAVAFSGIFDYVAIVVACVCLLFAIGLAGLTIREYTRT